jgi:acetoin utilization deacetylase AcuC-like enzyme
LHVYSDPASGLHVNNVARVEAPERFPAALAGVEEAERGGVPVERRGCRPAGEEALLRVHARAYLDDLEGLCAAGGGYLGPDTALNRDSWEAATLASGAAIGAVESALSGEAAFAVARPPGHHAGAATGMGFCLLNHVAVAAGHARAQGVERVAVLDWDVHHGNGTQDVFYDDEGVLFLSVHQSPFYPGTGAAVEVGEGRGRGFTANVPLPARSGEDLYAAAFAGLFLPVLREFRPGLLLVSAGYDAHAADPLGGMSLEAASFGRFAACLAALAREVGAAPLALVLEGGYDLGALTESVAATMRGIEGRPDVAWEYAGGARPVEAARRALAPFWESLR